MNTISLSKIAKVFSTRQTARQLFEKIIEDKIDALDFKDVEIVSRSFANELINLEKENDFELKKINMNKDVSFMFEYADKKVDSNMLKRTKHRTVSLNKLLA